MEVLFEKHFLKSIDKLGNKELQESIIEIITNVEKAKTFSEIKNIKKLKGFQTFYRIKLKDYRIGISFENQVVIFVEFGHRREIYRKFPK
jgi:mRNA interferase RelE/StbE